MTFQFDYSLDANHFFDTQAKRDLLGTAGRLLTDQLQDTLAAITPGGGNRWQPSVSNPATGDGQNLGNLAVPADVILIYAGGRDLGGTTLGIGGGSSYTAAGGQTWLDTVKARGEAGALGPDSGQTDFAPSVASVSFDTAGTNWFFGPTTAGLGPTQSDFLSVAAHELGHVLGIGTAPSWDRLVSGGTFIGPTAVASYGGSVPLAADGAHWAVGTMSGDVEAAMDPTLATGTRKLFTALDFAGLADVGWEVAGGATPGVLVAPTSGLVTTEAGGSASFTVVLTTVPAADVTINLLSSHPLEGRLSVASLTFTPANALVPQTVTVTGVADNQPDGDVVYQVVTAPAVSADPRYSGLNPPDVTLTNRDDGASLPPAPAPAAAAAGVADVTFLVQVSRGRLRFNPRTRRSRQRVTVTNVSSLALQGPLSLVVRASGAFRLLRKAGVTKRSGPAGSPYLNVTPPDGVLLPGQSATFVVEAVHPTTGPVRYRLWVLAGTGLR